MGLAVTMLLETTLQLFTRTNDAESSLRRKKQPWKEQDEKEPSHPSLVKMGLLLKVHLKMVMMERLVLEKKEDHLT